MRGERGSRARRRRGGGRAGVRAPGGGGGGEERRGRRVPMRRSPGPAGVVASVEGGGPEGARQTRASRASDASPGRPAPSGSCARRGRARGAGDGAGRGGASGGGRGRAGGRTPSRSLPSGRGRRDKPFSDPRRIERGAARGGEGGGAREPRAGGEDAPRAQNVSRNADAHRASSARSRRPRRRSVLSRAVGRREADKGRPGLLRCRAVPIAPRDRARGGGSAHNSSLTRRIFGKSSRSPRAVFFAAAARSTRVLTGHSCRIRRFGDSPTNAVGSTRLLRPASGSWWHSAAGGGLSARRRASPPHPAAPARCRRSPGRAPARLARRRVARRSRGRGRAAGVGSTRARARPPPRAEVLPGR